MNAKKLKIVFIGNSIVNGYPHKRSQCFVNLFRDQTNHQVMNKGTNGETSPQILRRFEKDVLAHNPNQVYLLGGTNDFIHKACTPKETLGYYDKIVELSRKNGIEPFLMVPLMIDVEMIQALWIPDVDYIAVEKNLILLRKLMLAYGEENKVHIVDTQHFFQSLYKDETKAMYLTDGLHPTLLGHEAIADYLKKISIPTKVKAP